MTRKLFLLFSLFFAVQMLAQDDIETVNIENRAVQAYMADAQRTYANDSDYSVSVIVQYNNTDKYGTKLYRPQGKEVFWTPTTDAENIDEIRITVADNEYYDNPYTFNPDKTSASSYVICNLLPNKTYYYKVEEFLKDSTCNERTSGVFKTTGQVRMIQVRGCSNVRDLGGWPTQYGKPIIYGRMFRSGNLDNITAIGRHDFVENLGVTAELDLRKESKKTKSPMGDNVRYLRIAHGGYLSALKNRKDVYPKDLKWIIAQLQEGRNVDWHCAIGCDRCGTLCFLIEGLLGVSELDICRDYELSTFMFPRKNKRVRKPLKDMFDYIRTFGPSDNLAKCFYNYWLSLGMKRQELDYVIGVMLDIPRFKEENYKAPSSDYDYDYYY